MKAAAVRMALLALLSATLVHAQGDVDCDALGDFAGMTTEKFAGMLPPCTVHCDFVTLSEDGCQLDDFACHCAHTWDIAQLIVPCLAQSTCQGIDIGAFAGIVDATCAYYNSTTNGSCTADPVLPTTLTGAAAVAATSHTTFTSGAPSVIPTNYSPSATRQLLLSFQTGTVQVHPGELLGIDVPAASGHQQIGLSEVPEDNQIVETPPAGSIYTWPVEVFGPKLYTVVMVDPDIPIPYYAVNAERVHWLQSNMRLINASTLPPFAVGPYPFILFANETSTPPQVPYEAPSPPNYSPAHRYILYLYEQPLSFTVPPAFANFNDTNRNQFSVAKFAQAAGLGDPYAANFFYAANNSQAIGASATGGIVSSVRGYPTALATGTPPWSTLWSSFGSFSGSFNGRVPGPTGFPIV